MVKSPQVSTRLNSKTALALGAEPEMCGNGIRCYAQFLKDLGADQKSYRINTLAGLIIPEMKEDGNICVDMVR